MGTKTAIKSEIKAECEECGRDCSVWECEADFSQWQENDLCVSCNDRLYTQEQSELGGLRSLGY